MKEFLQRVVVSNAIENSLFFHIRPYPLKIVIKNTFFLTFTSKYLNAINKQLFIYVILFGKMIKTQILDEKITNHSDSFLYPSVLDVCHGNP